MMMLLKSEITSWLIITRLKIATTTSSTYSSSTDTSSTDTSSTNSSSTSVTHSSPHLWKWISSLHSTSSSKNSSSLIASSSSKIRLIVLVCSLKSILIFHKFWSLLAIKISIVALLGLLIWLGLILLLRLIILWHILLLIIWFSLVVAVIAQIVILPWLIRRLLLLSLMIAILLIKLRTWGWRWIFREIVWRLNIFLWIVHRWWLTWKVTIVLRFLVIISVATSSITIIVNWRLSNHLIIVVLTVMVLQLLRLVLLKSRLLLRKILLLIAIIITWLIVWHILYSLILVIFCLVSLTSFSITYIITITAITLLWNKFKSILNEFINMSAKVLLTSNLIGDIKQNIDHILALRWCRVLEYLLHDIVSILVTCNII